jgi:hypothetical protein
MMDLASAAVFALSHVQLDQVRRRMAKAKNAAVNDVSKSQAQRLLEAAKAARLNGSRQNLSQSMGKLTLRRNGRKTAIGGVGGGAE